MLGYLRQSTASQSRVVGPFVDSGDFVTPETGLTIANTDVKLLKNGAASVDKNSGGGTHRANGNYSFTFDATDTDTVGELHVSILVSGALLVVAKFVVLEEAVYDALFAASANISTAVFTQQMTEAYAANGAAPTPAQALFAIHQMLMQFGISGTSLTVKKLDNSTTAFVVTLNSATTPTGAART